jgi:hypothetical protein
MKNFCHHALFILSFSRGRNWAEEFVKLRMEFHRKHGHGLILSTWHGIDFFQNVLDALEHGKTFDEPTGQYRTNFQKLIQIELVA